MFSTVLTPFSGGQRVKIESRVDILYLYLEFFGPSDKNDGSKKKRKKEKSIKCFISVLCKT
jgi:hypothetical protein